MKTYLDKLLAFVREHDCGRDAVIHDGAIWATLHYVNRDGTSGQEWQCVGKTLKEVRDWLNY